MDVRLVWARVGCNAYMKYVWVFHSGNDALLSFRLVSINPKNAPFFDRFHLISHRTLSHSSVALSLPLTQFCGLPMFWYSTKPQRAKNKTWIGYKNIEKSTNHFVGLALELDEQKKNVLLFFWSETVCKSMFSRPIGSNKFIFHRYALLLRGNLYLI